MSEDTKVFLYAVAIVVGVCMIPSFIIGSIIAVVCGVLTAFGVI